MVSGCSYLTRLDLGLSAIFSLICQAWLSGLFSVIEWPPCKMDLANGSTIVSSDDCDMITSHEECASAALIMYVIRSSSM